ncbi:hypothetical protein FDY93_15675 [Microbulbifer harenosus]|uniref:Uncharacterized protein n=1 Tax=Microbulbifer harenosus TaxID=2576840 RepID=A0ABY2UIL6_9GAMM|nr:hypothetical protein FDY93_15675 [Microbulbifer harenosus]
MLAVGGLVSAVPPLELEELLLLLEPPLLEELLPLVPVPSLPPLPEPPPQADRLRTRKITNTTRLNQIMNLSPRFSTNVLFIINDKVLFVARVSRRRAH